MLSKISLLWEATSIRNSPLKKMLLISFIHFHNWIWIRLTCLVWYGARQTLVELLPRHSSLSLVTSPSMEVPFSQGKASFPLHFLPSKPVCHQPFCNLRTENLALQWFNDVCHHKKSSNTFRNGPNKVRYSSIHVSKISSFYYPIECPPKWKIFEKRKRCLLH